MDEDDDIMLLWFWRRRKKRKLAEALASKKRGSRPGRAYKKPSLPSGAFMKLFFRDDCDSSSEGMGGPLDRRLRDAADFRKEYRVSRRLFTHILRITKKHNLIKSQKTGWTPASRDPVKPREALALFLARMGTKGEYFRVSNMYGRGQSTVSKWVDKVWTH